MTTIHKLWWGLYPLRTAFWGFYILGGLSAGIIPAMAAVFIALAMPSLKPILYPAIVFAFWAYMALATVGTWRSASNTEGGSIWPTAAKWCVGFVAAVFLYRMINGGAQDFIGKTMSSRQ